MPESFNPYLRCRKCAACGYWGGPRSTDPYRKTVYAEPDAMGACIRGSFGAGETRADNSCGDSIRWSIMEEPDSFGITDPKPARRGW